MDKEKVLIGIDPDVEASGWALYHKGRKEILTLQCHDLFTLFEELNISAQMWDVTVNLEAGWLIAGTWHAGGKGQAKRVGANHEIGRQIEKFCKKMEITCKLIKPQGYSGWDHDKFCKTTGWPVHIKTNSEKRVAGLLVFGY